MDCAVDGGNDGVGGSCAGFLFIKSTSLSYNGVDPRNLFNKTLGVGDVFGNGVGNLRFNFFSIVRLPGRCLLRLVMIIMLYYIIRYTYRIDDTIYYITESIFNIISKVRMCVYIYY